MSSKYVYKYGEKTMSYKFSIESLDRALDHPNIKMHMRNDDWIFNRVRVFKVGNEEYEIEWYSNICYLHHKDLTIPFQFVKQSNAWPHRSKMNLQFYDSELEVCCVLKIDDYGD